METLDIRVIKNLNDPVGYQVAEFSQAQPKHLGTTSDLKCEFLITDPHSQSVPITLVVTRGVKLSLVTILWFGTNHRQSGSDQLTLK